MSMFSLSLSLALVLGCGEPEGATDGGGTSGDGGGTLPEASCDDVAEVDLRVPEDHATLAEAIAAASSGDTICLGVGTWSEQLRISDRHLRIVGPGEPGDTVIDGSDSGRVMKVYDSILELEGLSVRGGLAEQGGGIYASRSELRLRDVVLRDNAVRPDTSDPTKTIGLSGAAISSENGIVDLERVSIFDNTLDCGDRLACGGLGGALYLAGDSRLFQVEILDTQVRTYIGSYGSAAKLTEGKAELDHVTIAGTEHDGTGYAWAVLSFFRPSSARVSQSDIVGNTIAVDQLYAGAISVVGTTLDLQGSHLAFNEFSGTELSRGEAIAFDNAKVTALAWNNIHDNGPSPFEGLDDPSGTDGNIDADPLFVDMLGPTARTWDLSLDPSSPSRDAGDPAVLDADGSRCDIGAYGGPGGSW